MQVLKKWFGDNIESPIETSYKSAKTNVEKLGSKKFWENIYEHFDDSWVTICDTITTVACIGDTVCRSSRSCRNNHFTTRNNRSCFYCSTSI